MNRADYADQLHNKKYNCAQAVVCAFSDLLGVPEEDLFKISEGLGAGGGDMQGTCGAVSGASLVIGYLTSTGNLETPNSKGSTYKKCKEFAAKFREQNGSTICKELKGIETGKVLRTCPDCIRDSVNMLAEYLNVSTEI